MIKYFGKYVSLLTWLFCIALTTLAHADGSGSCQEASPEIDHEAILADLDRKLSDATGRSEEELIELQTCRVDALITTGQLEVATTELSSLYSTLTSQPQQVVPLHLLRAKLLVAEGKFGEASETLASAQNEATDARTFEHVIITTGQLAADELSHSALNAKQLLSGVAESSTSLPLTPGTTVSLQLLLARVAVAMDTVTSVSTHIDAAAQVLKAHPTEFSGEIFIVLGDVATAGNLPDADKWYHQALDAGVKTEDISLSSLAEGRIGASLENAEKPSEALEFTRAALFHAQIVQDDMLIFKWQWQLSKLLRKLGQPESALAINQAAVETLQRVRSRVMAESPDAFRTTIRPVYLDLADLLLTKASRSDKTNKVVLLQKVVETIELLRSDELKDYLNAPCFTANNVNLFDQQLEESNVAIIYLIDFENRTDMIVRKGDLLVHQQALAPTRQIKAEAYLLANAMTSIEERYHESATRLYRWLIAPLEGIVQETEVLVFIPDGATRSIPFAALLDDTGKHLVESHAVVMNQGLSVTMAGDTSAYGQRRFFLGGISNAVADFRAIPEVAEELEVIEGMYSADKLQNQQFTVQQIGVEMHERTHPVVHLASHGQFTGDVDKSFILTWDGKLNIQDLSRMVNAGAPRGQTVDLITLSACSTAVGDDRAALGLAGVALKAGARSAIASLWNVDDEATGKFFEQFYKTLSQVPRPSKAEAVRKVQLQFLRGAVTTDLAAPDDAEKSSKDFSHPFFWAPFILTGNWY